MTTKKQLASILLAICAILLAGNYFLHKYVRFTGYQPDAYTESTAEIANPYIGWYEIHRYTLSDSESSDLSSIYSITHGPGLMLLEFNLQNYSAGPISDSALQSLDDLL